MTNREPNKIGLYLIEEQEVYRKVYNLIFNSRNSVKPLGVSTRVEADIMSHVVTRFQPDVLLLGPKRLQRDTIERLQEIRARSLCE